MSATNPSQARIFLLLVISGLVGTFAANWIFNRKPDQQPAPMILTETPLTESTK